MLQGRFMAARGDGGEDSCAVQPRRRGRGFARGV